LQGVLHLSNRLGKPLPCAYATGNVGNVAMTHDEAVAFCKENSPFWPVGEMQNIDQLIGELRIAGDRMLLQSGVMKDWSDRFYALADSLTKSQWHKQMIQIKLYLMVVIMIVSEIAWLIFLGYLLIR
jgi:hypothetical protein